MLASAALAVCDGLDTLLHVPCISNVVEVVCDFLCIVALPQPDAVGQVDSHCIACRPWLQTVTSVLHIW